MKSFLIATLLLLANTPLLAASPAVILSNGQVKVDFIKQCQYRCPSEGVQYSIFADGVEIDAGLVIISSLVQRKAINVPLPANMQKLEDLSVDIDIGNNNQFKIYINNTVAD